MVRLCSVCLSVVMAAEGDGLSISSSAVLHREETWHAADQQRAMAEGYTF